VHFYVAFVGLFFNCLTGFEAKRARKAKKTKNFFINGNHKKASKDGILGFGVFIDIWSMEEP
jgi:hypothetical protein